VRHPSHVLLTRQLPQLPSVTGECQAPCQNLITLDNSCLQNTVDTSCGCTQPFGQAVESCCNCFAPTDGAVWGQILQEYQDACNAAGDPFNPPLSLSPSGTQSSAPSPSQRFGFTNTTVSANDPRISTSGPDWKNSTSSCDSSTASKTNNVGGQTLTFEFTGSAVYMSTAQSDTSGQYSVAVDDQSPVTIDGFSNSQSTSCGFGWNAAGLQNALHTVVVTTMGQSAAAGSGNDASNLEMDGFVITRANSGTSSHAPLNSNIAGGFGCQFVVFAVTTLLVII